MAVDSKAVIIEWLTLDDGDNAVLLEVDPEDIVPRALPLSYQGERSAICFWRLSGARDKTGDVPIFAFRCYGGGENGADVETVADALWDRLDRKFNRRMPSGILVSSNVVTRFDMNDLAFNVPCPMVMVFVKCEICA